MHAVCAVQGGSDVITRTAIKRINWSAYKINQSSDKVGGLGWACRYRAQ
jgi:hypothetical protein